MSELRRRLMMQISDESKLPSGYQEVEWVQSANNKIISGIGNMTWKFELTLELLAGVNVYKKFWLSSGFNGLRCTSYATGCIGLSDSGFGNIYIGEGVPTKIVIDGYNWIVNNQTYTSSILICNSIYNRYINFGSNYSTVYCGDFRYWGRVKLYDNQYKLKNLLVPCYRISDNEVGFYDILDDSDAAFHVGETWLKGNDI